MLLSKRALPIFVLAVAGCSSNPQTSERLNSLESDYSQAASNPSVEKYAPIALQEAEEAVDKVRKLVKKDADSDKLDHYEYIASKKIATAENLAEYKKNQEYIDSSDVKRKDILLQAKEQDAQSAKSKLTSLEARNQSLQNQNAELAEQAEQAKEKYQDVENRLDELDNTLKNVSTEQSERGWIITMSDIEFDSGQSDLPQNVQSDLKTIADFLKQYPDRDILVEGFTDSVGSEQFNSNLSKLRADSVLDELARLDISRDRLTSKGYGEEYPVADNNTEYGRQQNRRVEIVLAPEEGNMISVRGE